jgi:Yip1-like protein
MYDLVKMLDARQIQQDVETWLAAISDPQQFLAPAYQPTKEQFVVGLEFYFKIVLVSLIIYALVALFVGRGSVGVRAKMLANALLGLIFFFVVAMAVHLPFWFLNGKASFLGTCLAYIYGGVPYAPFMAIAQWVMVSGMPPSLRKYALNPGTAQEAGQIAGTHPETDKATFFFGSLLALGVMIWSTVSAFRSLSFVHDLGGWSLAGAIVISIILSMPIGALAKRMSAIPFEDEPEPQQGPA